MLTLFDYRHWKNNRLVIIGMLLSASLIIVMWVVGFKKLKNFPGVFFKIFTCSLWLFKACLSGFKETAGAG